MSKLIVLLGRILFSLIFIMKSLEHFSPNMIDEAMKMGVPLASVLVPIAGLLALLGGFSILLGYKGRWGAWLLVIFLLPTAFAMHRFWQMSDPFATMMHHYCFWKNIALLGSALMITHFGTGSYSLDKR